jgi:hypothetical protein
LCGKGTTLFVTAQPENTFFISLSVFEICFKYGCFCLFLWNIKQFVCQIKYCIFSKNNYNYFAHFWHFVFTAQNRIIFFAYLYCFVYLNRCFV